MAIGTSRAGASAANGYASVAVAGRLRAPLDTLGTTQAPTLAQSSTFVYNVESPPPPSPPPPPQRWGDYSQTVVDPTDDMTMWTFQEYANAGADPARNSYAVRAIKLVAPPPATPDCSVPAQVTVPTQNVTITGVSSAGSGFFDPGPDTGGPGYANRLTAAVSGGTTVNSVTFNSPTSVTLNITATSSGSKNVTITNPDGQSIVGTGCINVTVTADLSISKTDGLTTAAPGQVITYTIVASNAGPFGVNGATVTDAVPGTINGVTWTCAGSGGGTCTASGSGNINDVVNLPVGGTVTYTLRGTISLSATGTLSNTATVGPPAGVTDPNLANNTATDSDTLVPQADLSITKTDGRAAALAGQAITYTIVASNAGPSNANGATVTDTVPAAFTGPSWTCAGSGGGTCTATGASNINDTVNLPPGASVTYMLSGIINPSATGTLNNTASVAPPGGTVDPNPGNNSATDSDPLVTLTPDNNTPSSAKDVEIGSTSNDTLGAAPADQNWFRYHVQAGRSYCVDVDNGKSDVSIRDTVLSVYRADGTTLIGSNDNIGDEPGGPLLSRVCYIATASEDNLADVTAGASGTAGGFRVRVMDTTLFCPWFFSGSGFEAFILVKNTTGTGRSATVTLFSPTGPAVAAPQSGSVPANGSYNLQVSAAPPTGFGLSSASGGVLIAHDGPPGALIANVTSLSFASGVSFDTPASPRQDFR
jgi:uncharacterized repeat protein (TIGR01451 family)